VFYDNFSDALTDLDKNLLNYKGYKILSTYNDSIDLDG
jgi:hypothetical protein